MVTFMFTAWASAHRNAKLVSQIFNNFNGVNINAKAR